MSIRTTVTLDDDVAEKLKREARSKGLPFRQVLNDAIRSGLLGANKKPSVPVLRIKPRRMGLRPGLSYDSVEALLEFGEGIDHR